MIKYIRGVWGGVKSFFVDAYGVGFLIGAYITLIACALLIIAIVDGVSYFF